jgi:putative Mg2+ transporter-C (MgtC) family protein
MSTHLGWEEIALRLLLTCLAGGLIGLDRGGHGHSAGLRTTLLVCLAASVSMIQANLLLPTAGKSSDSFGVLDLMRLPLGILTGMGFIGGGAILKRGDVVQGVTTAATLWFVTVIGLCFGGGQNALGVAALTIGMVVLTALKRLEALLPQDTRATLTVAAEPGGPDGQEIRRELEAQGFRVTSTAACYQRDEQTWTMRYDLRWRPQSIDQPPPLIRELSRRTGIARLDWSPQGSAMGHPD